MSQQQTIQQLKHYVSQHILGQEKLIDSLLIAILADGHMLVEGAPGLAKTRAIKVLSEGIEGNFPMKKTLHSMAYMFLTTLFFTSLVSAVKLTHEDRILKNQQADLQKTILKVLGIPVHRNISTEEMSRLFGRRVETIKVQEKNFYVGYEEDGETIKLGSDTTKTAKTDLSKRNEKGKHHFFGKSKKLNDSACFPPKPGTFTP